jgi:hypothetical protein
VSCSRERRCLRGTALIVTAIAVFACAVPPAPEPAHNPLVGTWANADNNTITIRQDTVVQDESNGQSTPLDSRTCNGSFSFGFATWNRDALAGLLPRQPNLDQDLAALLVAPTYRVAVLRCDHGDHTYVLLNDHELIAIYRDGDIGVVERLARR